MSRRQLIVFIHGLTLAGHGFMAFALASWWPATTSLGLAGAAWALTVLRIRKSWGDRRRPEWVTRWIDEPVFCHWGGLLFGLVLFIPTGLLGAISFGGLWPGFASLSWLCGLGLSAWAVWGERNRLIVRRFEVPIAGLAKSFDGFSVCQLSDLHVGSYDRRSKARGWVRRANALEPDLIVVTGDLVTSGVHYYDDAAEVLGELRAKEGVVLTMGNHDQWDNPALVAALRKRGLRVLKNASHRVERGASGLTIAGVDDFYAGGGDVHETLSGCPASDPIILLSHYPHVLDHLEEREVALVLSGHTHGGQLGIPGFGDRWNLATCTGQYARGWVRARRTLLYVSAGLGTTGPPMRLGIPPELSVFTLRSANEPAFPAAECAMGKAGTRVSDREMTQWQTVG